MRFDQLSCQNHIESSSTTDEKIQKWEQRKILLTRVNTNIIPIFSKIDEDFMDLFIELSIFDKEQQKELKKQYFIRNYYQILVHFFEFLFDFDLKTLKFKQKHEIILPFVDWLQTQLILTVPNKIKFLNKKKSQKQKSKKQSNTHNLKQESLKRSNQDRQTMSQQTRQVFLMSSPIKKKPQLGYLSGFIDYSCKFQEVTNHSAQRSRQKRVIQNNLKTNNIIQKDKEKDSSNDELDQQYIIQEKKIVKRKIVNIKPKNIELTKKSSKTIVNKKQTVIIQKDQTSSTLKNPEIPKIIPIISLDDSIKAINLNPIIKSSLTILPQKSQSKPQQLNYSPSNLKQQIKTPTKQKNEHKEQNKMEQKLRIRLVGMFRFTEKRFHIFPEVQFQNHYQKEDIKTRRRMPSKKISG